MWCVVLAAMFLLTGCNDTQKAEQRVSEMLDAMKQADLAQIQQFFPEQLEQESGTSSALFLKELFKNLQYTIVSSGSTEKDTVIVKTEISNVDLVEAFRQSIGEILAFSFENALGETITEQEMTDKTYEIFVQNIEGLTGEPVKKTVDISVKKQEGQWKVEPDPAIADAALAGLVTVFSEMEQAMNHQN